MVDVTPLHPWLEDAAAQPSRPLCISTHEACVVIETWLATELRSLDSVVELTTTTPWIGASATLGRKTPGRRRAAPAVGVEEAKAAAAAKKSWSLLGENSASSDDWRPARRSPQTVRKLQRQKQRFAKKAAMTARIKSGRPPLASTAGDAADDAKEEEDVKAPVVARAAVDDGGGSSTFFLTGVEEEAAVAAAPAAAEEEAADVVPPTIPTATPAELRRAVASMIALTDRAMARAALGVAIDVDDAQLNDATVRGRAKKRAEARLAARRDASASALQRMVRCRFSRVALRAKRARSAIAARRAASLQLQLSSRSFKARAVRRTLSRARQARATGAIQRVWRGQRARWRCHRLRAQRDEKQRRDTAVTVTQRRARGALGRRRVVRKQQAGAACKLQKAHRRRARLRKFDQARVAAAKGGGGGSAP